MFQFVSKFKLLLLCLTAVGFFVSLMRMKLNFEAAM